MKLLQINTVCNGSTGKIMGNIQRKAESEGWECVSFYGRRKGFKDIKCKKYGDFFSFWFHVFLTTVFDMHGYGSYIQTKRMIRDIKKFNPDVIHMHNIHGYYLNIHLLFKYLKNEYKGEIRWTLHDCWTFTGHCSHFTYVNCDKWKNQCYKCPNKRKYPISFLFDRSKKNYIEKNKMFTGLKNVTIITPSDWLNNLVKQSFLKEYKVITINNKIDTNIFKPTYDKAVIEKYNISNKNVLLGVANIWEEKKGLKDFIELSKRISDNYVIVLVGLNKKQIKQLNKYKNIIGIKRTENQKELAVLYTIAKYFINPTYEDNYPTVNLEAIACGTKVICYDTGGCKEQIDSKNGMIVNKEELLNIDFSKINI